jgi:large repetitive protein
VTPIKEAAAAVNRFRHVPVPAPVVTGISPASGPLSGGTSVTITGSNFTGATAVSFGGTAAASFTVSSDTSITAVIPAATSVGPWT